MKQSMSLIKTLLFWLKYLVYLMFASFILLEVTFRILPVSDSLKVQSINEENPIYHFAKNRIVTQQIGFNFTHTNKKKINNYGFMSDKDYLSLDLKEKDLAVVIGDSYVEARQVKNSDTFHFILDQEIESFNVYPLGTSGSQLSQYLAYADFAITEFNPDILIFLLYSNDFDESWYEVKQKPGFHYFTKNGHLNLKEYSPSITKQLARESAFIRYLFLDLKIMTQIKKILASDNNVENRVINTNSNNEKLGMQAIDFFLKNIEELAKTKKIILMIDGDRSSIYNGKIKRDMSKLQNRWFKIILNQMGIKTNLHLLDLHPVFLKNWKKNKKKFDYEYDGHWNEHGHEIVAKALVNKMIKLQE